MKSDLIFHLVSKRKWKEWQQNGYYKPAENIQDGWIECYSAEQVESVANEKFKGRKTILMLVINRQRLSGKVESRSFSGSDHSPAVKDRINLDAIIDKIRLIPDEEGLFKISIEVK